MWLSAMYFEIVYVASILKEWKVPYNKFCVMHGSFFFFSFKLTVVLLHVVNTEVLCIQDVFDLQNMQTCNSKVSFDTVFRGNVYKFLV